MKAAILLIFLLAGKDPSGQFTVSQSVYQEGQLASFTFHDIRNVTKHHEVTLGVWCFLPDGSQIRWGNRSNPYVYEINSFGNVLNGHTVSQPYLPVYGTGYQCTARLIAAEWFKGQVLKGWVLDEHEFVVLP